MEPKKNVEMHPYSYSTKRHEKYREDYHHHWTEYFQPKWGDLNHQLYKAKKGVMGALFGKNKAERLKQEIAELKEEDRRKEAEFKEAMERDIEIHRDLFEAAAHERSVKYLEDSRIEEAVSLMAGSLAGEIKSANRSPESRLIVVDTDFELRKVIKRDLEEWYKTGPLEEAAMAHALASELGLRITLMFPQDPSGTEAKIECNAVNEVIGFTKIHFRYSASNGSYAYDI